MRPVNLIPPEDRRGEHAPLRTGATAYVLVGVLAIALLAVTGLTLTSNKINDRNTELQTLEARKDVASRTAASMSPYVEFASMSAARDQTITSLAQSRFDWERVLRELSLVIPDDVWLISATGSVSPGTPTGTAGTASPLREGTAGPALELSGCASSQRAVAGFVAALEDIDGVTRVGVSSSERGQSANSSDTSASSDCRTRAFISRFEIVALFDEAPAASAAAAPIDPAVPPAGTDPAADPETADAVAEEGEAAASAEAKTQQGQDAAGLVSGGTP